MKKNLLSSEIHSSIDVFIAQVGVRLLKGLIKRDRKEWDYAGGQIEALRIGFHRILAGQDLVQILNEIT